MRIKAFEVREPLPELREPHALVMIRPWIDVGSVGGLTLERIERHFGAVELGKLARPGAFFDFTRYRPMTRLVNGQRETIFPNTVVNYAQPEGGPDLLFLRLLEPHAMAEDYIDSIVELLKCFPVSVYCRLGAMYDSVPHTRSIVVTGNTGSIQPRPGITPPLIQQRQSTYEGPTTIVTDYEVTSGNPEDSTLLMPAVKRHIDRVGKAPQRIAVDRGMASAKADTALQDLGVKFRCLPKTGQRTEEEREKEHSGWFRRLHAFRAGGEARISLLKRKYGWRRSRARGIDRVKTWVGWGVVAHNLDKYARMQVAKPR